MTALAYGLATSYTQGINKWSVSGIALQEDANDNIAQSLLAKENYQPFTDKDTALPDFGSATAKAEETDDFAPLGIDMSGFWFPTLLRTGELREPDEVVVSAKRQPWSPMTNVSLNVATKYMKRATARLR